MSPPYVRIRRKRRSTSRRDMRVFESVVEFDPTSCKFVVARHSPEAIPDHLLEDFRTFRERVFASRRNQKQIIPDRQNSAVSSDPDVESYQTNIEKWAPSSFAQQCDMQIGLARIAHGTMWTESFTGWLELNKSNQSTWFFDNGDCVQWVHSPLTSEWRSGTGWRLDAHIHFIAPRDAQWTQVDGVGFEAAPPKTTISSRVASRGHAR